MTENLITTFAYFLFTVFNEELQIVESGYSTVDTTVLGAGFQHVQGLRFSAHVG